MVLIAVAVAALDFAAIRTIFRMARTYGHGIEALIYTVPVGLGLNLALLRMLGTRGRTRVFWAGVLVCGAMVMASSAWAALTPTGSVHPTDGTPNYVLRGSTAWRFWNAYFVSAAKLLEALGVPVRSFAPASLDDPGVGYIAIVGFMAFLPQLAIALIGGLVARALVPARSKPARPSMASAE
jgi:hypothetical protein